MASPTVQAGARDTRSAACGNAPEQAAIVIDQLRILGKTYSVTFVGESVLRNDIKGQIDCCKQTIHVDSNMSADHTAETLLHESLHALDYDMQLDLSERQVHALGAGLLCVLNDNPELRLLLMQRS